MNKRAIGHFENIHFSFPTLSGDEAKQTMNILDAHPDILDEESSFNWYSPKDDLTSVKMGDGTIVVHNERAISTPKRITVETVVLFSRKDVYERIKFDVNVEELMG